jgi:hypothetical protein
MNMTKALFALGMAMIAASVSATNWTATKLNNFAVTNEAGKIIVWGTEGSYGNATNLTKNAVFDGDTKTFFDPASTNANAGNCWAGFELQTPKMVTRIRYYGRNSGDSTRMRGCLFQGSNDAFTNCVTLHVGVATAGWWTDVTVSTTNAFQKFKYLRIIGPNAYGAGSDQSGTCCGNAGEVEFYGVDEVPADTAVPAVPTSVTTRMMNGRVNYMLTADNAASNAALYYQVAAKNVYDADYSVIDEVWFPTGGSTIQRYVSSYFVYADTQFRIRAGNTFGLSDWTDLGTTTPVPFVTGIWFGQPGSYNGYGSTGNKAYNGNIFDYYDVTNTYNYGYTCLDLGKKRTITGIRYVGRADILSRCVGGRFQISETGEFDSDGVTIHTIAAAPAAYEIVAVSLAAPVTTRYVRYISAANGYGNIADIEWDVAQSYAEPASLAATQTDLTNGTVTVSWTLPSLWQCASTTVYRATSPGGPYTLVSSNGVARETTSWQDTNVILGVLYYYKLGGISGENLSDATASCRPCSLLERDWSDLSKVKTGMTVIYSTISQSWNGSTGAALFDGSLATFADYKGADGKVSIGVDLGTAYHIGFVRVNPRTSNTERYPGITLYGSNDSGVTSSWNGTAISSAFGTYSAGWHLITTTDTTPYRYVYVRNPTAEWFGNLYEVEIFGWPVGSAADAVLTAPTNLTLTPATGKQTVSWTAGANVVSYKVERRTGNSTGWVTLSDSVTGTSYDDTSVTYDGTRYTYRVTAVGAEATAVSDEVSSIPYVPGNGIGLWAQYRTNYLVSYNVNEAVSLTTTNSTINYNWGTGNLPSGTADNVGVVWNGKLIVPFDGTYKFLAQSDDGFALRIDGAFIANRWYNNAAVMTNQIALTAGEHDIRIDYFEGTGTAFCILKWAGCVEEAVIPASQFVPVPLVETVPAPWEGERTFGENMKGAMTYDAAAGAFTIAGGNTDLHATTEGHEFLWQTVTGSFDFTAQVDCTGAPATVAAKAMLLAKNSLTNTQPLIAGAAMITGDKGVCYGCKLRETSGANIVDNYLAANGTDKWTTETNKVTSFWMRLRRRRNIFTFAARNTAADTWQTIFVYTNTAATFNDALYVGPAVTAGSGTLMPTFIFSNPKITGNTDGTLITIK